MRVGAPPGFESKLPPQTAYAVGQALRRLLEQQLDTVLASARAVLVAEVEAAKRAARDEYDRELASLH